MGDAMRPAGSIEAVQDEIVAEMSGLDGSMERYEYLVRAGRALGHPEEGIRADEHAVPGCQSRVWIRTTLRDGRLRIAADSDALIVRGIIALLLRVLDGRTPDEIVGTALHFLDETGLRRHLSPSRSHGLTAMVRRIRDDAEAAAGRPVAG